MYLLTEYHQYRMMISRGDIEGDTMSKQQPLTESTFYVLMALYEKDTFGSEIVETIQKASNNRIPMGPGTLYTILSKFEADKLIKEIAVEGRKRTYSITPKGRDVFEQELKRLTETVAAAQAAKERYHEN